MVLQGLEREEGLVGVALGQFHSLFTSNLGNVYACGRGNEVLSLSLLVCLLPPVVAVAFLLLLPQVS